MTADGRPDQAGGSEVDLLEAEVLGAIFVPALVAVVTFFAAGAGAAVLVLVAGAVAGAAWYGWSRDLAVALVVWGLAPLLVFSVEGLLVFVAVVAICAAALVTRFPWVALIGAPAAFWTGPAGPVLVGVTVAGLLLFPGGPGRWSGAAPRGIGALAMVVVSWWAPVAAWAPAAVFALALVARALARHPRAGSLVAGSSDVVFVGAAALPAAFLGLVVLDVGLPTAPRSLLALGWGAVALGALVIAAGWGVVPLLEDTRGAGRVWSVVIVAGLASLGVAAAAGAWRDALAVAPGVIWGALGCAAAVGLHRLGAHRGFVRPFIWGAVAVAAAVAAGVQVLMSP